jgi:hypothetical protein
MMAARLQCHVGGSAFRRTSYIAQSLDFRMGFSSTAVEALADDGTIAHHDATYLRIGMRGI